MFSTSVAQIASVDQINILQKDLPACCYGWGWDMAATTTDQLKSPLATIVGGRNGTDYGACNSLLDFYRRMNGLH
jgi:hypothetical protein